MNRSDKARADVTALLRARNTLLWVVTREEARVERALIDAAGAAQYAPLFWDCATGLTAASGKGVDPSLLDPGQVLNRVRARTDREVYILRDLHKWLPDPTILRNLRSLARTLESAPRNEARSVVVLTPSAEVPPELAGHAVVIDWPLPDREEIASILESFRETYPDAVTEATRDACIDAAVGLTAAEATGCYSRSMVTCKRVDPKLVSSEKRRVIAREKVLTWYDPDPRGLDAVGGLDVLKGWLTQRKAALSQRARAFGLPTPKGVLLVGVPGCGKSLTAKAVATAWGLPLLRLDLGALRGKFVGESEGNIRKALQVAETVSPCVLWLDEIEKALAGATGSQGDGGVAADALGTILSWLQERESPVFVIATANDVTGLPPELLRKGRFDEVFFVDLPTTKERANVLRATLGSYKRDELSVDAQAVAKATEGFAGAEIAALVPDALFAAFADGERQLTTADLLAVAETVVPLSKTAAEKVSGLRQWAKGRARPASSAEDAAVVAGRILDI